MNTYRYKIIRSSTWAVSIHYQAILARKSWGDLLMRYFLPSSRRRIPIANVNGIKMCSTGTPYPISSILYESNGLTLVKKVFWKKGT